MKNILSEWSSKYVMKTKNIQLHDIKIPKQYLAQLRHACDNNYRQTDIIQPKGKNPSSKKSKSGV